MSFCLRLIVLSSDDDDDEASGDLTFLFLCLSLAVGPGLGWTGLAWP